MDYLACDLGAESGRLMLGSLQGGTLSLEELHRFPNTPVRTVSALTWDMDQLWAELKNGLCRAAGRGRPIAAVSTDTWGVDYILFDAAGRIVAPTYHYRDARTARGMERVLSRVDAATIFAETGIQFMPLNTLFQLAAETPERLEAAALLLLVGDGFNYLLSGVPRAEESMASTSQLYNPVTRNWSTTLLERVPLPARLFPPIVPSGTRLGPLRPEVARETGLEGVEVLATCVHDTGSAVAAVPGTGSDWAYLSSGTWSLMGVELDRPVLTELCQRHNFTNEMGYGGSVRLLKNIIGLWLVQECRRHWAAAGREFDYATLTALAAAAPPFVSLINPADPRFLGPGDMPGRIAEFCRETGQPAPAGPGATVRCALESLALLYRRTLHQLEEVTSRTLRRLHIVGGGSRNDLLNQLTADALERPVLAGPVEATALGNVLVQALGLGELGSLGRAREIVASSFAVRRIEPQPGKSWAGAAARFATFFGG